MSKEKNVKTNAMRIIEKHGMKAEFLSYENDGFMDGVSVAEKLGQPTETTFKTLVTRGKSKNFFVFVIPVAEELDLKKAAKAVKEKSLEMLHVKDLLATTGYVRGGCSPIGMKKQFRTIIHKSAKSYETVLEEKLEKALKKVEGVGEVSVVITLKNTSEKIIAADSDYSESVIQESDSAGGVRSTTQQSGSTSNIYYDTQEGSEPYVTKENMPEVEGIVIVAKGGGDGNVCADITAAAEALLGVPAHKIKVLKMN